MSTYNTEMTIKILEEVHDLFANDPKSWTTGVLARDEDGISVPEGSASAVCWCTIGAIRKFADGHFTRFYATRTIEKMLPSHYEDVADYNDSTTTTVSDVVDVIERAVAAVKEAGTVEQFLGVDIPPKQRCASGNSPWHKEASDEQ
jgi:hypothetical protein